MPNLKCLIYGNGYQEEISLKTNGAKRSQFNHRDSLISIRNVPLKGINWKTGFQEEVEDFLGTVRQGKPRFSLISIGPSPQASQVGIDLSQSDHRPL